MALRQKEQLDIVLKAKDQYSGEISGLKTKLGGLTSMMGGKAGMAAAATAAAVAIGGMVKKTADAGDMFQKMSLRTGFGVEMLSEYAHAAELSGTSINQMESGFKKLSKNMMDAHDGLSTQVRVFEQLGINVTDTNGELRDSEIVFDEVVKSLAGMKNETQQTAIAMTVFGRSGADMLPLIKSGADEIGRMRQEAHDLGVTFTDETANAAADFNDNMFKLKQNSIGLTRVIGNALIPAVNTLFDIFGRKSEMEEMQAAMRHLTAEMGKLVDPEKIALYQARIEEVRRMIADITPTRGQGIDFMEGVDAEGAGANGDTITKQQEQYKKSRLAALTEFQKEQQALIASSNQWIIDEEIRLNEAIRELNQQDLEEQREAAEQEREIEQQRLQDKTDSYMTEWERYKEISIQKVQTAQWVADEEKRIAEENAAEMNRINQLKLQGTQTILGNLSSAFSSFDQLNDGRNRSMFEALKVVRSAEALVNTYAGANQALATYPPPWGAIAAGTIITAGLANVAVINSASFGGGAAGGSNVATPYTAPTIDTQTPPEQQTGVQNQEITVIINNPLSTENWAEIAEEQIIPAINDASSRNITIDTI